MSQLDNLPQIGVTKQQQYVSNDQQKMIDIH